MEFSVSEIFPSIELLSNPEDPENSVVYHLKVVASPTRCNFAHADFHILKDGKPASEIKPTTLKGRIREKLKASARVVLHPPPREG